MFRPNWPSSGVQAVFKYFAAHCNGIFGVQVVMVKYSAAHCNVIFRCTGCYG
jgi:hypothetical protein